MSQALQIRCYDRPFFSRQRLFKAMNRLDFNNPHHFALGFPELDLHPFPELLNLPIIQELLRHASLNCWTR